MEVPRTTSGGPIFGHSSTKLWLFAVLNWSTNTSIGDSGYSPHQWVLGRSLRLPFQLFSRASQLASHQRHRDDFACQRCVAMLAEAQRSIISTRYNKALSRAFLSRARRANNSSSQVRFAVGDQVMYWRGNNKRKSRWSMRWSGPGIVIGHEGRANVRISHSNAVVKAAGNHVRLAELEEQLPWHDLYDSLRDIDEQTYFDLCTPGATRDPQYGNPSAASDVTMTPIPVADESMPDAVAGEPDTSEIPVLPNSSVYAPVRNPRVRWRSDALELPTPQSALPAVSSQDVPAATSPWPTPMSVIHETPPPQPPVTPHIDTQPETPLPTPSTDDEPMPLLHDDDTPPWVHQEPETQWIPTEQDTPAIIPRQVPSPPIQVSPSRESNMSTADPIFPPPPWFDETPTIPCVAKCWRSGTLHLENPVSKRWRSDTLHPETPVPTTTPPQLRWRAGVLRALRPLRSLRDKQTDPSEARVKRPWLAPAQIMSTALEKRL